MVSLLVHVAASTVLVMSGIRSRRSDMVVVGVVLAGIGTMQIAEYMIHSDPGCSMELAGHSINNWGSKLGYMSLLVIQPLFGLLGIGLSTAKSNLKTTLACVWGMLVLGNLFVASAYSPAPSDFCTRYKRCPNTFCSLDWPWDPWKHAARAAVWAGPLTWIAYFMAAMGLPLLAIGQPYMIVFLAVAHVGLTALAPKVWTAAASCYWGPLAVYGLYLFDVPARAHRR